MVGEAGSSHAGPARSLEQSRAFPAPRTPRQVGFPWNSVPGMLSPPLAALLLLAPPDAVARTALAQFGPGGCLTTYDCCVKDHPADAVEVCGYPPDSSMPRGPTPKPKTVPRPAKVEPATADPEPERSPEPPPTRPRTPVRVGPDVFPVQERGPEEAVRRTRSTRELNVPQPRPPKVEEFKEGWQPTPGEPPWRPCYWSGAGGPAPFKPKGAPDNIVRCTYRCGKYQVVLYDVPGKSENDCLHPDALKRAEKEAKNFHKTSGNGR